MAIQRLTENKIKNLKPKDKAYKETDGDGLYLYITPPSAKAQEIAKSPDASAAQKKEATRPGALSWRYGYRFQGIQQTLTLGQYPGVSLQEARDKHQAARALLAKGENPAAKKKLEKLGGVRWDTAGETFGDLAREFLNLNEGKWAEGTREYYNFHLDKHLLPPFGTSPALAITPLMLRGTIKGIEDKISAHSAKRALNVFGAIIRSAIGNGRDELRDITVGMSKALKPFGVNHYPAPTNPQEVGDLLVKLEKFQTRNSSVALALNLAPYIFLRSGELTGGTWAEVDLETPLNLAEGTGPTWRIPAERMKGRNPHIVPLSSQAVAILKEAKRVAGDSQYIFPSDLKKGAPIRKTTLTQTLRTGLYIPKDKLTVHGFRSMASTLLNERGFSPDWIEKQLAHNEKNSVRAAYNHSDFLKDRRKMMQKWGDYLDGLREQAKREKGE
jgi:integrase